MTFLILYESNKFDKKQSYNNSIKHTKKHSLNTTNVLLIQFLFTLTK